MARIVVPLDESELAEEALPWAGLLGRTLGVSVHLVAIWTLDTEIWLRAGVDPEAAPDRIADELNAYLAKAAARPALNGVEVSFEVRMGNVAEQITDIVEESDTRLVVITSHGRGGIRRLVQGSVADALVRTSAVPVMVVRAGQGEPHLHRLLVTLDGSEASELALGLAREIAEAAGAEIHLLRVVNPIAEVTWTGIGPGPDLGEITKQVSEAALGYLDETKKPGEIVDVQYGRPLDVILGYASEKECDVIVMATHGRGGVLRLALGSTADAVVRAADRPVLLIPERERRG